LGSPLLGLVPFSLFVVDILPTYHRGYYIAFQRLLSGILS
jgi:hypothetical protein